MNEQNVTTPESGGGVAALDRALAILMAFSVEKSTLTLAEMAAATGIYKSTILRISQSLIRGGLLIRLSDGRYRIGPTALRLGTVYQAGLSLGDIILPLLHELLEATGESAVFYVREGTNRVCLYHVEPTAPLRYSVPIGKQVPLHLGTGGRVMMAFLGEPGEPYESIRRDYYYVAPGDLHPEIAWMSIPVFGVHQELMGSIAIAGPLARIDAEKVERFLPRLMTAGIAATRALGGDSAPQRAALERVTRQRSA